MASICLYFHVHQPLRIKRYTVFDIGHDHQYFNDESDTKLNNKRVLEKVARKSYLPTNKVLLRLLKNIPEFKISYSFSGVLLYQLLAQSTIQKTFLFDFLDLKYLRPCK